MVKKILLIGECFSTNLGDSVICSTVQKSLQKEFKNVEIHLFDISGKVSYNDIFDVSSVHYSVLEKVFFKLDEKIPRIFSKFKLYKAYKKDESRYLATLSSLKQLLENNVFDIAVFAGGAIFMDYFAGLVYCIVRGLSRKNIPIIFHACGMGALSSESKALLRKALKNKAVVSISLRDSYEKFNKFFRINYKTVETYDTALSCSKYYPFEKNVSLAEYGIGLINIPCYLEDQKKIVKYFLDSAFSWKIFTNGSPRDQALAENILGDLGVSLEEISKYLLKRPESDMELIKTVRSFKKIISFRMHSQIIASSYGIPCVGVIWDKKIKEMYEKLDMPNNAIEPSCVEKIDCLIDKLNKTDSKLLSLRAISCGESSERCLYNEVKKASK